MRYVHNTDMYSMENRKSLQYEQRRSIGLSDALMDTIGEDEVVIGDPTNFNIRDQINTFDHGWDLDENDAFLILR